MSTEEGEVVPIEERAKQMGWAPKETWRGRESEWIDAETFVKRGEELLPILRATNRDLQDEVSATKNELASLRETLKASQEAINELKEFNSEANLAKMKESRQALTAKLKEARSEGDVEAEVEIRDQLDANRDAMKEVEAKPTKPNGEAPPDFTKDPAWIQWKQENPWWGTNVRKSSIATAIAAELRADPANKGVVGKAFFDKVTAEVEATLNPGRPRTAPKVEGANGGAGGNSDSQSYNDLPADAKTACENMAKRVVGQGRAYDSVDKWRKAYAAKYFST